VTSPIAAGGMGAAPASAAFEMTGAAPAAAGANAPATMDPSLQPFAGVLARLVSLQSLATADARPDAERMMRDALASLESAVSDGAASAEGLPMNDAGTSAIKALLAQVARQGMAGAANTAALGATPAGAAAPVVDGATLSLGAAAMIVPPTTPSVEATAKTTDSDRPTARTEGNADDHAAKDPAILTGNATAPVDPSAVVRETAALDPAFKAKLDRVIARMQSEFGHTVTVVETVRNQARQDALYGLGRTAPGQVVTWTRNSRHADGLAADVMIDGGYDNAVAFERLQRIANEEGLHTLGARDAGHLELRVPSAGGFTARMTSMAAMPPSLKGATPAVRADAARDALARIAQVAHVAEVAVSAGVARVAAVARVATPGAALSAAAEPKSATRSGGANATHTTGGELPAVAVSPGGGAAKSSTHERGASDRDARPSQPLAAPVAGEGAAIALPTASAPRGADAPGAVSAIGPNQGARVDQIDALHDQAAAQPVSSMVLNVDDGHGGTDRIRVDVRGASVASTIDVRDPQGAAQLADRSGELARALEAHGLESEGVRVRTVAAPTNADALRAAAGGEVSTTRGLAGALATEASTPSRRDRDTPRDPRAGSSPQEQDSHRQRSRREREDTQP